MEPLASNIDTADSSFHANREHNRALVAELNERLAQARQGAVSGCVISGIRMKWRTMSS